MGRGDRTIYHQAVERDACRSALLYAYFVMSPLWLPSEFCNEYSYSEEPLLSWNVVGSSLARRLGSRMDASVRRSRA
jgi:hypothetical protein